MTEEIEPISGDTARVILESAIAKRLGVDWNDEQHGWAIISKHDFMARLTKDGRSVDFYVDLMGDLTIEEKAVNPGQDMGRLLAGLILLASVLVAVIIAKLAGYL